MQTHPAIAEDDQINAALTSGDFWQDEWDAWRAPQWEPEPDPYAYGCGECGCCPCGVAGCPDCPPNLPEREPWQCEAVTWERAVSAWTRCREVDGHHGMHCDGALMWGAEAPDVTLGLVHGVAGAHAIVTASVRQERKGRRRPSDIPDFKRRTHKQHRRAWRMWTQDPMRDEPRVRVLTSWEVW